MGECLRRNAAAAAEEVPTKGGDFVVLVIDDSEIARTTMVEILSRAGLKVIDRPSPIGTTRVVLTYNVGVVVIDLLMPGMRGDRLASLFRGNPRLAKLGVVLVSGETESELKRLSQEAGADAVVSKNNLEQLVPAVMKARRKAEGRDA
jgi:CheY-like chemotaxis protein